MSEVAPKLPPDEGQMLDVLYEVLAQGPAPRSTLTRELVERFLHEHARSPKPISELVSFFEQHGLPVRPEEYGADAELAELATGLQRERSSLVPGFAFAEPDEPTTLPPATLEAIRREQGASELAEATGKRAPVSVVVSERRAVHPSVYAIAAAVLLALAAGLILSHQRATDLEYKLEQARMQQKSQDVALTKLEQRAEGLQGSLNQSEQDYKAQVTRVQNELAEQAKQRAAEELAVEKMLGPRYAKLRQKLAQEAAAPAAPAQPAR